MEQQEAKEKGCGALAATSIATGSGGGSGVVVGDSIHDEAMSLAKLEEDPFATRKGRHLVWQNVNLTLKSLSKSKGDRKLLDFVWGEVPPKQTTAIMGPSGAGKTSLLNVLSGRVSSRDGKLQVSADIRVNDVAVNPIDDIRARTMIAYVEQQDSLTITSTPREAIRFSAKLRLPKSTPDEKLDSLTNRMLQELGLDRCADTMVGGRTLKGLSGGERKRTSVGVELVVKPSLVFLDEPTSGLDSFSAVQLCKVLKKVAESGAAVLFTIHQPSSQTFSSFDRLILLHHGRIMYQGAVDDVPESFARNGYPIPAHHNPADFVMDIAQATSVEELEQAGFFPKDQRDLPPALDLNGGAESKEFSTLSFRKSFFRPLDEEPHPGFSTQVTLLMKREFIHIRRNVAAMKVRFGLTCFMSTLVGFIFLNVGSTSPDTASNIQSIFGGLMMAALANVFTTVLPSLIQFPEERPVFVREYSTKHYSVLAYFLSKFAMETVITGAQVSLSCLLTFLMIDFTQSYAAYFLSIYILAMASTAQGLALGSALDDPSVAFEFLPPMFVPQILFSGFFVRPELIPNWLSWLRYIFALTYTVRILLVEEFDGNCDDISSAINGCQQVLDNVGANPDEVWWYWLVLIALFFAFRLLALLILQRRAHF